MHKFTCPYCYGEHTINTCSMKCSFNIYGTDIRCEHGVDKDDEGWIPKVSKSKCLKCKDARKSIFCDIVKKEIPMVFLSGKSLPIALIGSKASGKSNYIAVLIDSIRRRMSHSFECTLDLSCSEESWYSYSEYYFKPLFEDGRVIQANDADMIPPLIFPLRFMNGRKIKNIAALTFYDTAGENFDSIEDIEIYNRYLPNSKGIILLLDPLQIHSIRSRLEGKIPLPPVYTEPAVILNRVIDNIRNVKNIKGTIDIPLAVVFTKIDALEQFDILPPNSCLRHESEHLKQKAFVLSDFENTNKEMEALLEDWLNGEILEMMKQFSKCSIFGLSAFGGIPDGERISGNRLRPRRVLDPLLWLLAENNYIKTIDRR